MKEFDKSITLDGRDKKTKVRSFQENKRNERQRLYEAEKRKRKKQEDRGFRFKDYIKGVTT